MSAPDLEREGDIAADFLEELLDIADLDGDLDIDVEGDRAAVSIVGGDLTHLVGRDGEVLDALQELTRLAVHRETGERSRLMLDIGGHRAAKREALTELANQAIADVQGGTERVALEPMTAFERKVVHDAVAAAGLVSESEGAGSRRHVVITAAGSPNPENPNPEDPAADTSADRGTDSGSDTPVDAPVDTQNDTAVDVPTES